MKTSHIFIISLLIFSFACKSTEQHGNEIRLDPSYLDYSPQNSDIQTKYTHYTIEGEKSNIPLRVYSYYMFIGQEYIHGDDITFFRDSSIRIKRHYQKNYPEGEYLEYHAPDTIKEKGFFKDGQLEGEYLNYYKNGQISAIQQFKKGKLHGPYKSFYDTGEKYAESNFIEGQLEKGSTLYFRNGQVQKRERYKKGKLHGMSETYFANGDLKRKIAYKEGKPWNLISAHDNTGKVLVEKSIIEGDGVYFEYTDSGQKTIEMPMRMGIAEGLAITYDSAGWMTSQIPYAHGQQNGESFSFYENGQIEQKVLWVDDITIDYKYYNEAGTLILEVPFKDPPFTYMDSINLYLVEVGGEHLSGFFNAFRPGGGINGIEDGCVKAYFDNGKIKEIHCYNNGDKDSLQATYYANGQVKIEKMIDRNYEDWVRYEVHYDSLGNEIQAIRNKLQE